MEVRAFDTVPFCICTHPLTLGDPEPVLGIRVASSCESLRKSSAQLCGPAGKLWEF